MFNMLLCWGEKKKKKKYFVWINKHYFLLEKKVMAVFIKQQKVPGAKFVSIIKARLDLMYLRVLLALVEFTRR